MRFKVVVVIDNYDSFTYNIVQYLEMLEAEVSVYRNNEVILEVLKSLPMTHLLISPGPKTPTEAGITLEAIGYFKTKVPILGVCLGHQAICQYFGGSLKGGDPVHGKVALVNHNGAGLFKKLKSPLKVTRYHSLSACKEDFPEELEITGTLEDGTIMAVTHKTLPLYGVQFHPEAILTEGGLSLFREFLKGGNRDN